jgi:hypothetical protein
MTGLQRCGFISDGRTVGRVAGAVNGGFGADGLVLSVPPTRWLESADKENEREKDAAAVSIRSAGKGRGLEFPAGIST